MPLPDEVDETRINSGVVYIQVSDRLILRGWRAYTTSGEEVPADILSAALADESYLGWREVSSAPADER